MRIWNCVGTPRGVCPSPPPASLRDMHQLLSVSGLLLAAGARLIYLRRQHAFLFGLHSSTTAAPDWGQSATGTSTAGFHLAPGTSSLRCAGGTEGSVESSHPRGREKGSESELLKEPAGKTEVGNVVNELWRCGCGEITARTRCRFMCPLGTTRRNTNNLFFPESHVPAMACTHFYDTHERHISSWQRLATGPPLRLCILCIGETTGRRGVKTGAST